MGCDIHLYKEKKINGIWVTADEVWRDEYDEGTLDVPYASNFNYRHYPLFGFLSRGVRQQVLNQSFVPRGMPFNACKEVVDINDVYRDDHHSHSYLSLSELKDSLTLLESANLMISFDNHIKSPLCRLH